MLKVAVVLVGFVMSFGGALASACPTQTLKCSLESLDVNKTWRASSQATAIYRANPSQCMARVTIVSPDQPNVNFMAVASADQNVLLFTTVGGQVDYSFSKSGDLSQAPVALENSINRFTCELE